MSERARLPESYLGLANALAEVGEGIVRQRDFFGRKVAREYMQEIGLVGVLDDEGDAALTDLLGTCVTSGIVLGMRKTTDQSVIDSEAKRLQEQLPPSLKATFERLMLDLIPRGIEFYEMDMTQNSPRTREWTEEFRLLATAGQE